MVASLPSLVGAASCRSRIGRPQTGLEHEEKVLVDITNTANKTASARVKGNSNQPT
jgi:hypothetical protein